MRAPTLASAVFLLLFASGVGAETLSTEYKLGFTAKEFEARRLDVVKWANPADVAKEFGLGLSSMKAKDDETLAFLAKPGGDIMFGSEFREFALKLIDDSVDRVKTVLHGGLPAELETELQDRGFFSSHGMWSKTYTPTILLLRLSSRLETRSPQIEEAIQTMHDSPGSTTGTVSLLKVIHAEMDAVLASAR